MVNEATTLRHTRFDTTEKTRKVELLETMIRDFTNTSANLAREIGAEEERTRIKDPNHVAYSMLAKALAMRRGKLLMSTADAEMKKARLIPDCFISCRIFIAPREYKVVGGSLKPPLTPMAEMITSWPVKRFRKLRG